MVGDRGQDRCDGALLLARVDDGVRRDRGCCVRLGEDVVQQDYRALAVRLGRCADGCFPGGEAGGRG